jgi:putative addiction module component (TIGR02574 family)
MINSHAKDLMKYPGATVDPISEPDVEAAWSAEIEPRLIEIDAGMVEAMGICSIRIVGRVGMERRMALDSETVETLEAAALQLTPADRASLVDRLIATLDADPEVEEAWAAEVERRQTEMENGTVTLLPSPEASPN